jgi:hypothetical protein
MIFSPVELRARLKDRPFTPLRIVTSAGESHDVYHPDLLFVATSFVIVGKPSTNDPSLADAVTRIAYAHITEMRDLPVPAAPPQESAA